MTPKTDLLTRQQVAALLSVDPRSVTRYAKADDALLPVKADKGKPSLYDPATVGQWLVRRELSNLQRAAGHADPLDYDRERCRLVAAQADKEELKVREMRRQLARVELLQYAVADAGQQIAAVLGTVKGRVKRAQPNLSNAALHEIEQLIVECQNTAGQIEIDWDEAPEVSE